MDQNFKKKRLYQLLTYNKKHHLQLLKDSEILTDELKRKLFSYSAIQFNHLNWEIRDQYLELLENYMKEKIDSFNFRIGFCERYESVQFKLKQIVLSPDKNSLDFADFLSTINNCYKAYADEPEFLRDKFDLGDLEFRTSIEAIYLKVQDFLNKEEMK